MRTYLTDTDPLPFWERDYMTGEWKGGRSKLARDGVTIGLSYVTDILANPIGGDEQGFAYTGSTGLDIAVDFGAFSPLKGLEFFTSLVWRAGTSLTSDKIRNQFPVAQVYGGQNVRLNEFYLKQVLLDGRLIARTGRLDAGNYFLQSDLYYKFVNNGFDGNPIAVFFNGPFTAYPNATWGALLESSPLPYLSTKFGVFLVNSRLSQNKYHGLEWSLHNDEGVQLITEWGWKLNQLEDDKGLPGTYRFGYFYYTKQEGNTFSGDTFSGNYGYYFLFDQMVYRSSETCPDKGLTPFLALLFSPKNRNLFPFFLSSGLVYKGLFPSRPHDYTNLGFIYGYYSKDQRYAQHISKQNGLLGPFGNEPQLFESVLECNHWFHINPWFTIVPDIQYIIRPKGTGNVPNACVIGMQLSVTL